MGRRNRLASIQVPPTPLRLMVIELGGGATFRARPIFAPRMVEVHVDLSGRQLQFHSFHMPGRFNAQNPPIQFTILHTFIVPMLSTLQ
jgi:hypothetical protein